MTIELTQLLAAQQAHARAELRTSPEIQITNRTDIENAPKDARRWWKFLDATAVVADLKGSTKLGLGKYAASTASIYEAGLTPVTRIFKEFNAGWLQIQGDCVVGVFWGDNA